MNIDENFLKRTYTTTLLIGFLFVSICLIGKQWSIAFGLAVGTVTGLVLFKILELTIKEFFVKKKKFVLLWVGLAKYLIIACGFYLIVKYKPFNIYSFAIGLGLIYLVITLKVVGKMIFEGNSNKVESRK
jgi:hypothetical protein